MRLSLRASAHPERYRVHSLAKSHRRTGSGRSPILAAPFLRTPAPPEGMGRPVQLGAGAAGAGRRCQRPGIRQQRQPALRVAAVVPLFRAVQVSPV